MSLTHSSEITLVRTLILLGGLLVSFSLPGQSFGDDYYSLGYPGELSTWVRVYEIITFGMLTLSAWSLYRGARAFRIGLIAANAFLAQISIIAIISSAETILPHSNLMLAAITVGHLYFLIRLIFKIRKKNA